MNLAVIYELSDRITYLKPHIKIECFFRGVDVTGRVTTYHITDQTNGWRYLL